MTLPVLVYWEDSTFLGVQINLHRGVATGVKNLTSMDLQDGHGSGSANEWEERRQFHGPSSQATVTTTSYLLNENYRYSSEYNLLTRTSIQSAEAVWRRNGKISTGFCNRASIRAVRAERCGLALRAEAWVSQAWLMQQNSAGLSTLLNTKVTKEVCKIIAKQSRALCVCAVINILITIVKALHKKVR